MNEFIVDSHDSDANATLLYTTDLAVSSQVMAAIHTLVGDFKIGQGFRSLIFIQLDFLESSPTSAQLSAKDVTTNLDLTRHCLAFGHSPLSFRVP